MQTVQLAPSPSLEVFPVHPLSKREEDMWHEEFEKWSEGMYSVEDRTKQKMVTEASAEAFLADLKTPFHELMLHRTKEGVEPPSQVALKRQASKSPERLTPVQHKHRMICAPEVQEPSGSQNASTAGRSLPLVKEVVASKGGTSDRPEEQELEMPSVLSGEEDTESEADEDLWQKPVGCDCPCGKCVLPEKNPTGPLHTDAFCRKCVFNYDFDAEFGLISGYYGECHCDCLGM